MINHESIVESKAVSADIDIPAPSGLSYLPYQMAGIDYAVKRRGTLIGDEMGLGKTIQGIGVYNYTKAKTLLVICPSSLKLNWKKEIEKWSVQPIDVAYGKGKHLIMDYGDHKEKDTGSMFLKRLSEGRSQCLVLNYEILGSFRELLRKLDWGVLIVDESHYIKNPQSKRTKEVVGGSYLVETGKTKKNGKPEKKRETISPLRANKILFLTGTPILNMPVEIWTTANFLAPEAFPNQWAFWNRYCDFKKNFGKVDVSGRSNMEELQNKLRSNFMVRRLKSQVLKDLPPKRRQIIEIPAEGRNMSSQIKEERKIMEKERDNLYQIKRAIAEAEETGDMEGYQRSVQKLKKGAKLSLQMIAKVRKQTAILKAPLIADHVLELLDSKKKIIVFAHHKDVISIIQDKLSKKLGRNTVVRIMGADKIEDREIAKERFQNDPDVRVFIGSIKAAGVGLTLTKADMIVFAELDWVPANILQAEDRAHRIGLEWPILIQHFVMEESIDSNMANKIVDKMNLIDHALDKDSSMASLELPILPD